MHALLYMVNMLTFHLPFSFNPLLWICNIGVQLIFNLSSFLAFEKKLLIKSVIS